MLSLLLGYPDSNQERQDQNLQCYHYTIAQCFGVKLACFSFPSAKVLLFFETANFYRIFLLKKVTKMVHRAHLGREISVKEGFFVSLHTLL